jgi:CheY-like chemotaxis protein
MNLTLNAKGSMTKGGKITIETKNVTLAEPRWTGVPAFKPGVYVMIAVTDTGCGMDASTQARIFEPFFTTKESAQGAGLGLSIVYGIVKQNGGDIRVFSEPGKGTRVEILLPCGEQIEDRIDVEVGPDVQATNSNTRAKSSMILVVENEATVRQLISEVLHNEGYNVRIARDGDEALRICAQQAGKVELVLTDIAMPGMSGPAMVDTLLHLNQSLRVLYMSGHAGEVVADERGLAPGIPFIQKPFTPVGLIGKIREVLDKDSLACLVTEQQ